MAGSGVAVALLVFAALSAWRHSRISPPPGFRPLQTPWPSFRRAAAFPGSIQRRPSRLAPPGIVSPVAPLRPCRQPGCPALVAAGYCAAHRGAGHRTYDAARGTTAQRGYGIRHQRWRAVILARDPMCRRCGNESSTVAHHIVALRDGGGWSYENGMGLCSGCHNAVEAEARTGRMGGQRDSRPGGGQGSTV